jgi:hypothetical protein
MNSTDSEQVGKVFVVVGSMRRCLICERVFTPPQAAEHAATPCHPSTEHHIFCDSVVSSSTPVIAYADVGGHVR